MSEQPGRASGVAGAQHRSEVLPRCCSLSRSRALTIVSLAVVAVVLAGVLFTSFATVVVAAPGDWPAYNHDASRSGVSSDREPLGGVQLAWTSVELDRS